MKYMGEKVSKATCGKEKKKSNFKRKERKKKGETYGNWLEKQSVDSLEKN